MKSFESIVRKLIIKDIDIDEACAKLGFWANSHPKNAEFYNAATVILSKLYDDHLIGENVQKKLLKAIQLTAPGEMDSADDEDDEDETVVAPSLKKKAEEIIAAKMEDEDEDATVLASHMQDITVPDGKTDITVPDFQSTQETPVYGEDDDDDTLKPGSI